jgi:putative heme-binding domain-containing protein
VRRAARIDFEHLAPRYWIPDLLDSRKTHGGFVESWIAMCHSDAQVSRVHLLDALTDKLLNVGQPQDTVDLLRLYELALVRLQPFWPYELDTVRAKLEPRFPSGDARIDRELAKLLVFLDSPIVIEPLLATLEGGAIQEEKIHAAYCLRALKSGWSIEQRKRFFTAVDALREVAKGGFSLTKYIDEIRKQSVAGLSEDEKRQLGELVAPRITASSGSAATASFVRAWNAEALMPKLREPLHARSFEHGKAAYAKATCAQCHRIGGEGGATGPDLTGAGSRFSRADLAEAILEPSKAISDQYQDTEIVTKDGDLYVGRLERDDSIGIALRRLPPSDELVEFARDEIESRRLHPLSRMPSGLVDVLTEDEILDLFAYVLSGANEHDASFSP